MQHGIIPDKIFEGNNIKIIMKSPFKFLDSYTREDRAIFFGRDQEITELYRRVFEGKMLLVYGISGTGKSSLVNCGLASRFDESDWLPVNVRRGNNIVDSLNDVFSKQALTALKKDQSVREKLQSIYLDHFKPVYLLFDQFEELFIFGSQEEKEGFISIVKEITESETQCRIIFIIREEFLAGMTEFESELPEIFTNRFRVEKMKRANAISAVEGPCKVFGIETEPGFSEELIDKLCPSGNEIELTYLQIYLDRIFRLAIHEYRVPSTEDRGPSAIIFSKDLLSKAGSVSDLLGQFLDEQIRDMENPDTGMAILKSFVSVQGTRRQMTEPEIQEAVKAFGTQISEADLIKNLNRFVDLRILRERDEASHFELRHDSLATKVFEKFTALEKDIIEVKQFIENEYSAYEKRGKLLSAEDLKFIAPYEGKLYLNRASWIFILKSKNELARATRRRRIFAGAAAIALVIVLSGFTIWALNERKKALFQQTQAINSRNKAVESEKLAVEAKNKAVESEKQAVEARNKAVESELKATNAKTLANESQKQAVLERNRAIASELKATVAKEEAEAAKDSAIKSKESALQSKIIADKNYIKAKANSLNILSQKIVETDPTVALRLAEYAVSIDSMNPDNVENLNRIYYDNNFYRIVSRHEEGIYSVAFSPDGKSILTGSYDKTARLCDLQGNVLQVFKGHEGTIRSVAFSPDGKNILTGSADSTACLWDLKGGLLKVFKGHKGPIYSVAFSPDGGSILTGSGDNTARLYDLQGNALQVFKGHKGPIYSVAFSPDGKSILTGSWDKNACLWDLKGNKMQVFRGYKDPVYAEAIAPVISVAFSPDGKSILSSSGGAAFLSDLKGNSKLIFEGHQAQINSVAFSASGNYILTGSNDKTARLWDLQGNLLNVFKGHQSEVFSVAFSPDGKSVLTGSLDKTARFWGLQENLLHEFKNIYAIAFSPDGKSILGESEKTAGIWDLQGNVLQVFEGIQPFAFSPDGKSILGWSRDKNAACLWDLQGNVIQVFKEIERPDVWIAAFSPDGKKILIGSYNGKAKLWDLQENIMQVFNAKGLVSLAAYSPDGKSILTDSSPVGTASLWDLQGNVMQVFKGHEYIVRSVAFSPDSKTILTGSWDRTARLWDLKGNTLQVFRGHEALIFSVAFSPDGKMILTGSGDKTARLWDLQGNVIQVFPGHDGEVISVTFSPDGKSILVSSEDGTSRLWEIKKPLKEFQKENAHQDLSIEQKIKYGIIDSSNAQKADINK